MSRLFPIPISAVDSPICARCRHHVDVFEQHRDMMRAEIVFIAHCHGKTEVVRIGEEVFVAAPAGSFSLGEAFKDLPAAPALARPVHKLPR